MKNASCGISSYTLNIILCNEVSREINTLFLTSRRGPEAIGQTSNIINKYHGLEGGLAFRRKSKASEADIRYFKIVSYLTLKYRFPEIYRIHVVRIK